jgi:hypothetical protein
MPRVLAGSLVLLLAILPAPAQDPDSKKKDDKPLTPREQYQAIVQEYQKARDDYFKAAREAKTPEERSKLKFPQPQPYGKRMMELAEKNPKDPVTEEALAWVVTNIGIGPENDKAIQLLLTVYPESKHLGPVAQTLAYSPAAAAKKQLQTILDKNPHHDIKGFACFGLAQLTNREVTRDKNLAEREEKEAEKAKAEAQKKPTEAEALKAQAEKSAKAAQAHKKAAEQKEKEAENLFERVVKEFADIKWYRKKTIGDGARGALFEMHNLAIGKTAPDIAGEDIDGKKFKLSDYRGKVVLLDFWGNW